MIRDHWHDMDRDFRDEVERRLEAYRALVNAAKHVARYRPGTTFDDALPAFQLLTAKAGEVSCSLDPK